MASLGEIIKGWQQRILAERLPVPDARNWALRNMAKFSRLSAEQVGLARRAATLGELELLLMDAPLAQGSSLGLLMASEPADIAILSGPHAGALEKNSPGGDPSAYADLVFTAVTPCRVYDSRVGAGGAGPWAANSTHLVQVGPYPGGYAFQGGSATSCGLDALATASGQIASVLAAVSTVNQAGAGYLTFFSAGSPNPAPYGVVQYFQPGYVQTSFLLMNTDRIADVRVNGFVAQKGTEVIVDAVGYFARPRNELWAVINANGTIARSYRTTSAQQVGFTGAYEVIFQQDVTGCQFNATPTSVGSGRQIAVDTRAGNANGVFIEMMDSAGTAVDSGFHVNVRC